MGDLGELTAGWLAGRVPAQPGYGGTVDVDEEDAPGLTRALVALNRAGFVTNGSQAGFVGGDRSGCGTFWRAHAFVAGLIHPHRDDLVHSLHSTITPQGFEVLAFHGTRRTWFRRGASVVVTTRDDGRGEYPNTGLSQMGGSTVADLYQWCSDDLIDLACDAWQINVYDPEPGRNELWPALWAWAARAKR